MENIIFARKDNHDQKELNSDDNVELIFMNEAEKEGNIGHDTLNSKENEEGIWLMSNSRMQKQNSQLLDDDSDQEEMNATNDIDPDHVKAVFSGFQHQKSTAL